MNIRPLIYFFLAAASLLVFWQAGNNQFITLDDPGYIFENPHVISGLTLENVRWAFTTTNMTNWHPLTWLSHMADCQLYGLNPRGHHLTNVFLHLANTMLLFLLLDKLTGALWRSAFVAALFAFHPLHVESVAWVAERKDVLSTLFFMLTLLSYVRYVKNPVWTRYSTVLLLFTLGLMTKPMLVTLPFVLLLLDYWPLGRLQHDCPISDAGFSGSLEISGSGRSFFALIKEKIPLFALASISVVMTLYAQQTGGAISGLRAVPFDLRVLNAVAAWGEYIKKMVLPFNLAVVYPLDPNITVLRVIPTAVLLLGISCLAVRLARRHPYFIVGWLWYLGTLVPVIGIVQVGLQSMADRYTYIPSIGLFIAAVWGLQGLIERRSYLRIAGFASGVAITTAFAACTWVQLGHWKNSIELFTYANRITANNFTAHNSLGAALVYEGKIEEAIGHFSEAIRIEPGIADAYYNMGVALEKINKVQEAAGFYRRSIAIRPNLATAHNNLGTIIARMGGIDEAVDHFSEALRIDPDYVDAHFNMGIALASEEKCEEAISHFSYVLRVQPENANARSYLEKCLHRSG